MLHSFCDFPFRTGGVGQTFLTKKVGAEQLLKLWVGVKRKADGYSVPFKYLILCPDDLTRV